MDGAHRKKRAERRIYAKQIKRIMKNRSKCNNFIWFSLAFGDLNLDIPMYYRWIIFQRNRSIISYWMFQLKFHINYEKVDSETKKHIFFAHFFRKIPHYPISIKTFTIGMASYFQTIFLHEKSRILQIVRESKQKHSQHTLIMTMVCVCKCQSECIWHWIILNGKMCLNGVD